MSQGWLPGGDSGTICGMATPHEPPRRHRPPQRFLLEEPVLVMRQVTAFMTNNFDILDRQGEVVGTVITGGSTASRFFMGSRSLTVTEADGRPVLSIEDTVNFGRDTFELADPHGRPLAHLRKRFSFFASRVDMHLADGTVVELHGNVLSFNFEFRIGELVPARVSRQWSGFGNALLGRSRYMLAFEPDVPPHARAAIIGGVVALDLIRGKEDHD